MRRKRTLGIEKLQHSSDGEEANIDEEGHRKTKKQQQYQEHAQTFQLNQSKVIEKVQGDFVHRMPNFDKMLTPFNIDKGLVQKINNKKLRFEELTAQQKEMLSQMVKSNFVE